MPFNISTVTASPNPIPIPGNSTLSYSISGTAGTKLEIEYSLSPSNDIIFVGEPDPKKKKKQITLQGLADINEAIKFGSTGSTDMAAFFVTVTVTNKSNGFSKLQKVQIRVQ